MRSSSAMGMALVAGIAILFALTWGQQRAYQRGYREGREAAARAPHSFAMTGWTFAITLGPDGKQVNAIADTGHVYIDGYELTTESALRYMAFQSVGAPVADLSGRRDTTGGRQ